MLKDNGKINFLIDIHSTYAEALTGGIVAMHKLAYEIAKRGHNVYTFCEPHYPHENISVINSQKNGNLDIWKPFSFNITNTVSVYPQIRRDNPFNTKHVVRWLLYHTEKDVEKGYGDDDYILNFGSFKTHNLKEDGQLSLIDFGFDKFFDRKQKRRGICHLNHKNTHIHSDLFFKELNSTDLSDWKEKGSFSYMAEKLNEHEYFYTYDEKSFWAFTAALCGCKVVICNPFNSSNSDEYEHNGEKLTPTEYRLQNPLMAFGVAYGAEDLNWAIETQKFVYDHLKELEKIQEKQLDKFISYWEQKILMG